MPSALKSRLAAFLSTEPAERVQKGKAKWATNGFGQELKEVRSLIVHVTAGWPPREKVEEFVIQYIGPPDDPAKRKKAGIGTQYFLSGDGTVLQTINDMPRLTWHASKHSLWSIGVETGNLGHGDLGKDKFGNEVKVMPQTLPIDPAKEKDHRWRAVGPKPNLHASDVGGIKLWFSLITFNEVLLSWWTTNAYNGPAREPVGEKPWMLFTEWQYRSWALLARYLCEQYDLPRNFPVLPHALRSRTVTESSPFRRIVLADERFPMIVRSLSKFDIHEVHFDADLGSEAALQDLYRAKAAGGKNPIWDALFDTYRGIHGHGFSGFAAEDHDCPGPLFDWHRFAREVWDWWWYPFDFTEDRSAGERARRPERKANGTTPLVEYYFEARNNDDFDAKRQAYLYRTFNPNAMPAGIFNDRSYDISSPSTFRLESWVPIYAPANGELVAARFPLPDPPHPVSLAFVLMRHEIFHLPNTLTMEIEGSGSFPIYPGRIDYNHEPSYVYSLVMHLGRPDGMSFDEVTDANPDWLNRVLIRKKECELGIARYHAPQPGDPPIARWDSQPPGSGWRPSLIQGLVGDKVALGKFLDALRAGKVAQAPGPGGLPVTSPIRVILGDFLGESGVIRYEGGRAQFGIRLEVFSSEFVPPTFHAYKSSSGWRLPSTPTLPACLEYQSEWAKTPTAEERQRLAGIGVNPDLVPWWREVALSLSAVLPPQALLKRDGMAFHIPPLDFMRWINEVTWASEWPKYKVRNPNGTEVRAARKAALAAGVARRRSRTLPLRPWLIRTLLRHGVIR